MNRATTNDPRGAAKRSLALTTAAGSAASLTLAAALAVVTGCGGAPPPKAAETTSAPEASSGEAASGPSIESEIGGLNEAQVKAAFGRASSNLSACFNKGAERLPYLAGEVRFVLRIKKDGAPRFAFVKDSTLGDRGTEECMLGALKSLTWPKPQGGEGIAENSFAFEPSADERPPVALTPEQLGKEFKKARSTLAKCRATAGAIKATMYIDTDGKPLAIGASSADERADAAIGCVISTLQAVKFASPGSYAGKVTLTLD
jgi:hypothetical protein